MNAELIVENVLADGRRQILEYLVRKIPVMSFLDREGVFGRIKTSYQVGLDETQQRTDALLPVDDFTSRFQAIEVCLLFTEKDDRNGQASDDRVHKIGFGACRPDGAALK